jgi:hypothetical protein
MAEFELPIRRPGGLGVLGLAFGKSAAKAPQDAELLRVTNISADETGSLPTSLSDGTI